MATACVCKASAVARTREPRQPGHWTGARRARRRCGERRSVATCTTVADPAAARMRAPCAGVDSRAMQRAEGQHRRRRGTGGRVPPVWLAVFAVALALRVGYAWIAAGPNARPTSDPATYDTV